MVLNSSSICKLCNKKFKNTTGLLRHIYLKHNISTQDYYDMLYSKGYCKVCNKPTSFLDFYLGYRPYCSSKCAQGSIDTKNKRLNTVMSKYNCTNVSQIQSIKDKKLISYKENLSEIQEKIKSTNKRKYNCEWYTQSDNFKNKSKQTHLQKYGVDNISKTDKWLSNLHNKIILSEKLYTSKGYIPVKDLFLTYGTGWYQSKIVTIYNYHHKAYIKDSDLTIVDAYAKRHKYSTRSNIEDDFINFIKTFYNGTIITNTRKIITPYELDIYLPELSLGIEINGQWTHSIENGCTKEYHLLKSIMCRNKSIRLIHIYEFEHLLIQKQLLKELILGTDNYPNDFNKNNFLPIPKPTIICTKPYTIYGAGKLYDMQNLQ